MKIIYTTNTEKVNWDDIPTPRIDFGKSEQCLHDNYPMCNGTGVRKDGLGMCIHMISCPCPKCSPR